jgi:hypothetical protein
MRAGRILLVLFALAFGWFVWPTEYRTETLPGEGRQAGLLKINRFSGKTYRYFSSYNRWEPENPRPGADTFVLLSAFFLATTLASRLISRARQRRIRSGPSQGPENDEADPGEPDETSGGPDLRAGEGPLRRGHETRKSLDDGPVGWTDYQEQAPRVDSPASYDEPPDDPTILAPRMPGDPDFPVEWTGSVGTGPRK